MNDSQASWFRVVSWLAVCLWTNAIVFLSSLSGPEVTGVLPFVVWDKFLHFFAFVVGGILLALALRWSTDWGWRYLRGIAWLALAVFSAIDELHQLVTPGRSGADALDWLADVLGAATGILLTHLLHARYSRADRPAPAEH